MKKNNAQNIINMTLIEVMMLLIFIFFIGFGIEHGIAKKATKELKQCKEGKGMTDLHSKLSQDGFSKENLPELPELWDHLVPRMDNDDPSKNRHSRLGLPTKNKPHDKPRKTNLIGMGRGSCWIREDGKTEDIFSLEMHDHGFKILKAWRMNNRNGEAAKLGLIKEKIENRFFNNREFEKMVTKIFKYSNQLDPPCHFLAKYIDRTHSKKRLKMQEDFINKYLVARRI